MVADSRPALATMRVDHVGSLLRPDALKEAVEQFQRGAISAADLRTAQDVEIRDVIAAQEDLGFPFVNDGEFRRINFQDSFGDSVSGYAGEGHSVMDRKPVEARLKLVRNRPLEEYKFNREFATRPVKVTLVSADRIAQRFDWQASSAVYPSLEAFTSDVVEIERQIVGELVRAGCQYIQTDAPGYTAYVDQPSIEQMRSRGEDPDANLERGMRADNAVIEGFPGVTFGIHLCRGNNNADQPQARSGHYDAVAERLFNTLKHDRFLLEYDTDRAGSFEPLRFVPKGKTVVLGLVSTKLRALESPDDLKRRIEEASRCVPVEQLALSPQCGFASRVNLGENRLTEDEQWRKLELVLKVASEVWG
jgi:5-methyltetrahydropteroyltriglutamate--homocysteine methyltransferase